ncbi:dynamin family protein [Moorellaceae bacterium AZ2]
MDQVKVPGASDLLAILQQALDCLANLEPRQDGAYHKLEDLKKRLLQERFHLAVLGQFKRGKSTLLNALLGAELLPTAVLPLTAIPTFLLWDTETRVRVLYQKGYNEEVSFPNIED